MKIHGKLPAKVSIENLYIFILVKPAGMAMNPLMPGINLPQNTKYDPYFLKKDSVLFKSFSSNKIYFPYFIKNVLPNVFAMKYSIREPDTEPTEAIIVKIVICTIEESFTSTQPEKGKISSLGNGRALDSKHISMYKPK